MKKLLLITCCLLVSAAMLAQPTMQYPENAPVIGDISEIQCISPDGLSQLPVGPDVTWDFSQITPLTSGTITAIDPTTAPDGNLFPSANIALNMNDSIYTFGLLESIGFFYIGAKMMIMNIPITMVYSDSRTFLRYPFTYLDSYTDSYKGISSVDFTEIRASGESTVLADAWGTLILPIGTFNNVLRIVTVDVEVDSIFVNNIFTKETSSARFQYIWYAPTSTSPLFSMEILQSIAGTDTTAFYSTTNSGIGDDLQDQISQLRVYPNPAERHITITFETSPNAEATISIVSQLGQVVISKTVNAKVGGSVNENIDISTLPSGIYFANISCDCNNQLTEKFVIR